MPALAEVQVDARQLLEVAMHGNGRAVIVEFAKVQQGCLGCHEGFCKSFVEHFHGER